jgi:hypothetical protein
MRILLIVLTLLLGGIAAAQENWQVERPRGFGFSVEFPAASTFEQQKVDLGGGQSATMSTWQVRQLVAPGAIYDVTVAAYPKGSIDASRIEEHLNNARNGALANAIGPLISETKIDLAGRPARELVVDMTMGMNSRMRIFFVGDSVFNIGVITRKGNERSPGIERFFTSFKLTEPPKP